MGFFVILLAMNMKPTGGGLGPTEGAAESDEPSEAILDMQIAIREAFNNPVNVDSPEPEDAMLVQRILARQSQGAANQAGQPGDQPDVRIVRPTDHYGLAGSVAFERGARELTNEGRREIDSILPHIRGLRQVIEIRGHVSAAESYNQDDSGMQLSYARADAVAAHLAAAGIGWDRLRLIACADNERIVSPAYDDAGHAVNQRVEIVATSDPARGESSIPATAAPPPPR
jgi:outer membrane protein OmpA-like peptidoglycan-associated protein